MMSYEVRNGRLQRTAFSVLRGELRKVWRTDTTKYKFTAQEKADEKWLSRSRPYPNKGVNEAKRRLLKMVVDVGVCADS
jgi:hypothetical protein